MGCGAAVALLSNARRWDDAGSPALGIVEPPPGPLVLSVPPPHLAGSLCQHTVPMTAHHLIPRAVHRKKRFRARFGVEEKRARLIPLCRLCHNAEHEFIPC